MSRFALCLALSFLVAGCDTALRGTAVTPPKQLASFDLTSARGERISTEAQSGRPMLVFFGYTRCPDVCPTTLADWARVRAALGQRAENVRWLFVSVDGDHDTADITAAYAAKFDASFTGVVADAATLQAMQKEFGASSFQEPSQHDHGYTVAHSPHTFLLDDRGRLVAIYSPGTDWNDLLHDLQTLL